MNSIKFAAAAFILLASSAALAVNTGDAAPEVAGPGLLDGKPVKLSALRGKVVLLDFWASWCAPCKVSLPELDALRRELHAMGYAGRFEVLAVNVDTQPADGRRFLETRPVAYPVLSDPAGAAAAAFALPAMPSSYLIGADGRVAAVHSGYRAGDAARLKAGTLALLQRGK
ncbi:MAG TPA: TlpA disulfide reductase family protein [Solimonas sp.]|nr:TlpA disulfide reductase family protein [Solimonas sp.]